MGTLGFALAMLGLGLAGFYVAAGVSGLFITWLVEIPDHRRKRATRR